MRSQVPGVFRFPFRWLLVLAALIALGLAMLPAGFLASAGSHNMPSVRGVNLIHTASVRLDSPEAAQTYRHLKRLGATWVALVPFFWQPAADRPELVPGDAVQPEELAGAIRAAHAAGLKVLVKPHIWVPQSWAGAIDMKSRADWDIWFGRYRAALLDIAAIANREKAEGFAIGTELVNATFHPGWPPLIRDVRREFRGLVTYVAHGERERATVPFWSDLDIVAVSMYPPMGESPERQQMASRIKAALDGAKAIAKAAGKPFWAAEIGIRSAEGAQGKPWESPEERDAHPDPLLQADVIGLWLTALDQAGVDGVFVWRWFADPLAGGPRDTDFTVQNKPAEGVIACAWGLPCPGAVR